MIGSGCAQSGYLSRIQTLLPRLFQELFPGFVRTSFVFRPQGFDFLRTDDQTVELKSVARAVIARRNKDLPQRDWIGPHIEKCRAPVLLGDGLVAPPAESPPSNCQAPICCRRGDLARSCEHQIFFLYF